MICEIHRRRNHFLIAGLVLLVSSLSACSEFSPAPQPTTQAVVSPTIESPTSPFGPVIQPGQTKQPTVARTAPPTSTRGAPPTNTTAPTQGPTATGPTSIFGPVVGPNAVQPITTIPTTPQPSAAISASATPVPTQPPGAGATVTFGAIIGPNYTPPPTLTPVVPTPVTPANVTLPPAYTPGPSPTPGPVLRADLMGVQIHENLTNPQWMNMLALSHNLGVGWVKVQVQWKVMEPQKGVFSPEYYTMALNIQRASSPQLRTLLSIAKAPDWARPASARGQEDGPPDNPQDLADFVRQLVHDTSAGNIDAIEVWNEANLIREWHGKPFGGAEYMKYFDATYQAIETEQKSQPNQFRPDHRIIVLTAGPAPTITTAETENDRDWIAQLYQNGLKNYGSDVGIGAHPYGWANPPDATCCKAQPGVTGWFEHPSFYFRNTLDEYHAIILRNGDTKKLWVTEFGWATYDGLVTSSGAPGTVGAASAWETLLNQQQQASYVLRAFYLAQKPPYYDFLGPMMLWNLSFATIPDLVNQGREEAGFSLMDQNGNPRPVYLAVKNAAKQ